MENIINWIVGNKEWIFSGIGVLIISTIIGIILKKRSSTRMNQRSGDNSVNIQSSGNVNYNERTKNE